MMDSKTQDGLLALDQPFLKIPIEQMNKCFRGAHKLVEKEVQLLTTTINDLVTKSSNMQVPDVVKSLDTLAQRMKALKKKLEDVQAEEARYLKNFELRKQHLDLLKDITDLDSIAYDKWNKTRLDRLLVDYMLREGYYTTASLLAQDTGIMDLVDIELFSQSRKIEESLQKGTCTECLQWCADNKSRLKKLNSTLEFNLRLQEYIELVRNRKIPEAIAYARKYFTQWTDTHLKEIKQAMGLLAFPSANTRCEPYRQLYNSSRWQMLIDQFYKDNYLLYSIPSQPFLTVTLQAGLSALKSHNCYEPDNKNPNCPVCNEYMGELARKLPFSHHIHSALVCRITGEPMDAHNPPMVLPNHYVYSESALLQMAKQQNGIVHCPRTDRKSVV